MKTQQQLKVTAHFSDGSKRDVTRLGCFAVNNELHAGVTDDGVVTGGDFGETAVVARFERKFAAVDVIVLEETPNFVATPVPTDHFVDQLIVKKLNDLRIAPSPPPLSSEVMALHETQPDAMNLLMEHLADVLQQLLAWSVSGLRGPRRQRRLGLVRHRKSRVSAAAPRHAPPHCSRHA